MLAPCWLAYVSILEFCCCWFFFFGFPSSPWTWTGKKQQDEQQQATHLSTHSSIHSPSPYVFALSLVPPAGTVELWGFRYVIMFGMWVFGLVFPELPSKRVLKQLSWLCSSLFSFACSSARLTFSPHVGGVHGAWVIVASHYVPPPPTTTTAHQQWWGGRLKAKLLFFLSSSSFSSSSPLHFCRVGNLDVDNESIIFPDGFRGIFFSLSFSLLFYPLVLILDVTCGV